MSATSECATCLSSAYDALFQFLVDQSCPAAIGTQHDQAPYLHVLGGRLPMQRSPLRSLKSGAAKGLPKSFAIDAPTTLLAEVFTDLQEKRHAADYGLTTRFKRSDVLVLIEQVEDAMTDFKALPASNNKRFFLACLWAWSTLANRQGHLSLTN